MSIIKVSEIRNFFTKTQISPEALEILINHLDEFTRKKAMEIINKAEDKVIKIKKKRITDIIIRGCLED